LGTYVKERFYAIANARADKRAGAPTGAMGGKPSGFGPEGLNYSGTLSPIDELSNEKWINILTRVDEGERSGGRGGGRRN